MGTSKHTWWVFAVVGGKRQVEERRVTEAVCHEISNFQLLFPPNTSALMLEGQLFFYSTLAGGVLSSAAASITAAIIGSSF